MTPDDIRNAVRLVIQEQAPEELLLVEGYNLGTEKGYRVSAGPLGAGVEIDLQFLTGVVWKIVEVLAGEILHATSTLAVDTLFDFIKHPSKSNVTATGAVATAISKVDDALKAAGVSLDDHPDLAISIVRAVAEAKLEK